MIAWLQLWGPGDNLSRTIKQLEGDDGDHIEDEDVGGQDADGRRTPPPAVIRIRTPRCTG